jgi:hypothetical protein
MPRSACLDPCSADTFLLMTTSLLGTVLQQAESRGSEEDTMLAVKPESEASSSPSMSGSSGGNGGGSMERGTSASGELDPRLLAQVAEVASAGGLAGGLTLPAFQLLMAQSLAAGAAAAAAAAAAGDSQAALYNIQRVRSKGPSRAAVKPY